MGTLTRRSAIVAASVVLHALVLAPPVHAASAAAAAEGPVSAKSAALVSQIAARLGEAKGVRARFTQTQTRAALKQPLVSSGSLLLMRERGVIWRIDTPYQATYLITDAGVSEVSAAGERIDGKGPSGTRGVAQVSRMMRAMLGGDLSALYSQFDVQAQGTPARWRMQLTPNQPQLAQAIKGLQMAGGDYLQTLRITLANGDVTALDFTDSTAVTEPTPAEQKLFGAP